MSRHTVSLHGSVLMLHAVALLKGTLAATQTNLTCCAASATQHPSSRVMLAALKFFLGQDEAEDAGSDDDEEGGSRKGESGMAPTPTAPSSKEVYAAKAKVGTFAHFNPQACLVTQKRAAEGSFISSRIVVHGRPSLRLYAAKAKLSVVTL